MQDHQEILENIPAYALGALDRDDAEQLTAHIANCSECQAELRLYQRTSEQLGLAAAERPAPAEIKDRLFSQIRTDSAPVNQDKPGLWQRWFAQRPALAWVSVGLVLLLALSNLLLWNQVQTLRTLSFRLVNLSSTDVMPEAVGMIVISGDGKYGTLVASDLTQLPEEQQYQLWLIKNGDRTSGGVFSVSESGYAALKVYSKESLDHYDSFGITIEPYGGSPGPTGDKVLGGEL